MPISAPSLGGNEDKHDPLQQSSKELYDQESLEFPGLKAAQAENLLKRLGAGVVEKYRSVEAIGWRAEIEETDSGVIVHFDAHEELLDDLLRRFEEAASRESK